MTSGFNGLRAIGTTLGGFASLAVMAAAASGWIGWHAARMLPEISPKSTEKDSESTAIDTAR